MKKKNRNTRKIRKNIVFYVILIAVLAVLVFPMIMMLSVSLKETSETIGYPPTIIPRSFTLKHFADTFNESIFPFMKYFKNSMYIALITSVLVVFLGILGGYALARLRFKGKNVMTEMFFFVYMFSGILLIVPLYKIGYRLEVEE